MEVVVCLAACPIISYWKGEWEWERDWEYEWE